MREIETNEAKTIVGGLSAAMFGAFLRGINVFMDMGRALGSSIRRIRYRNMCRL